MFVHLILETYKLLFERNFYQFGTILQKNPQIINSLRTKKQAATLLMKAANQGQHNIVEFLLSRPQDLSVTTRTFHNALHFISLRVGAAFKYLDETQITDDLLNQHDHEKKLTPLHFAAKSNNQTAIKWLLDQGADPLIKDFNGKIPDDLCEESTKKLFLNYK